MCFYNALIGSCQKFSGSTCIDKVQSSTRQVEIVSMFCETATMEHTLCFLNSVQFVLNTIIKYRTYFYHARNNVTIQDVIEQIRKQFTISEEETIIIREVTEEKIQDEKILSIIRIHKEDESFIRDTYKEEVDLQIQQAYEDRNRYEYLWDPKYMDDGAIFDIMAHTVIESGFQTVMAE